MHSSRHQVQFGIGRAAVPGKSAIEILGPDQLPGCGVSIVGLLSILSVTLLLVFALLPNFIRTNCGGALTACKSNLKNMGTAMEMYAADWNGHYPRFPKYQLTPNYLKTIPECSTAGRDTYVIEVGPASRYNTEFAEDYYFIYCRGEHHFPVAVPANYPQYNSVVGLIER